MREIAWKQLQYGREQTYYEKLHPVLMDLQTKYEELADKTQQLEREFFKHLSHSVKIDKLEGVSLLLRKLNQRLNLDLKINLFLFQSPVANAFCIPRYGLQETRGRKELVILVSQHFFNELDLDQQMCILGHELAHLLYGHVHIPAKAILDSRFPLGDIRDLKSDVLKWLTCAEISCDVIGFLSAGCSKEAFSLSMLRYTTGLSSSAPCLGHEGNDLVLLLLDQFDEISDALLDSDLTTHPLTPLRLKIVNAIADADLVKRFGQSVAEASLAEYKREFDGLIDSEVAKIYPEVVPERAMEGLDILFDLCIAVALSDGKVTPDEIEAIKKILGAKPAEDQCARIKRILASGQAHSAVRELLQAAVAEAKQREYRKVNILGMLRQLLVVAASDGRIEKCELETIFDCSKEFGFTREEIVVLMGQLGFH